MNGRAARARGFTIVEMAVTIAVVGVMAASAATAYARLTAREQDRMSVHADAAALSESLIAFAAGRHRLPCPSMDDSGHEGTNGVCAPGVEVGMFPYHAVGVPMPAPNARALYGVYRDPAADLATAAEHTGDIAGSLNFAGRGDFVHALRIAAGQPLSAARPFLTGDGAAGGAENCAGGARSNPAFVIVLPGTDRDGDGRGFDGIHQALPAGRCFAAPTRAADSGFDDTTHALGFYTLLARLNH